MSSKQAVRPYSTLPETYALLALVVWIDLMVAAWPNVTQRGFLLRAVAYGVMLGAAGGHSWLLARREQFGGASQMALVTTAWMVILAGFVAGLEWRSVAPAFGILAFLQIAQVSFMLNHATLRLTHMCAFVVMLIATIASPKMPLSGSGIAWVSFFVVSIFLMAYDRTAQKAGPLGFNRGERRHTGQRMTITSSVALAVAFLFFLMPMIRWPKLPRLPHLDFFESTLAPDLKNDPIMRVTTYPAVQGPLYLRGQAYDSFDGVRWYNKRKSEFSLEVKPRAWAKLPNSDIPGKLNSSQRITQTYEMLVDLHEVIFTTGRPTNLQFPDGNVSRVRVGTPDQTLRVDNILRSGTTYSVESYQDVFPDRTLDTRYTTLDASLEPYLKVPDGMSPRVYEIARDRTRGATSPFQKAVAIESYLRNNFAYSLTHDVKGNNVVHDFLFRTKKGHCALFASAMVVLARTQGLPARYVSGFVAQNATDHGFIVRASDGHAWVEVYIPGAGWIAFDPTSSNIDQNDRGTMDLTQQNNGEHDSRVTGELQNGGGLYGRPPSEEAEETGRGSFEIADGGSNGSQGGSGGRGDIPRPSDPGPAPGGDGNGSGGDGPGPDGSDSSIASSDPPDGPGGANEGSMGGGGTSSGSSDGRTPTVVPPGGDTSLPQTDQQLPMSNPLPSIPFIGSQGTQESPTPSEIEKPAPNDPEKVESDWRFVLLFLILLGGAGLVGLLVWTRAVRPAVDQRRIREALPLSVDDDPDPRRFIVKLYHTMVAGLTRVGMAKRDADTPAEFAQSVAQREKAIETPVSDLTELFHVARYDDATVTREDAVRARGAWTRIATGVKRIEPEEA